MVCVVTKPCGPRGSDENQEAPPPALLYCKKSHRVEGAQRPPNCFFLISSLGKGRNPAHLVLLRGQGRDLLSGPWCSSVPCCVEGYWYRKGNIGLETAEHTGLRGQHTEQ